MNRIVPKFVFPCCIEMHIHSVYTKSEELFRLHPVSCYLHDSEAYDQKSVQTAVAETKKKKKINKNN